MPRTETGFIDEAPPPSSLLSYFAADISVDGQGRKASGENRLSGTWDPDRTSMTRLNSLILRSTFAHTLTSEIRVCFIIHVLVLGSSEEDWLLCLILQI